MNKSQCIAALLQGEDALDDKTRRSLKGMNVPATASLAFYGKNSR